MPNDEFIKQWSDSFFYYWKDKKSTKYYFWPDECFQILLDRNGPLKKIYYRNNCKMNQRNTHNFFYSLHAGIPHENILKRLNRCSSPIQKMSWKRPMVADYVANALNNY